MGARLAGKSAIVTGGGSGFGAGIARAMAAEGARVLVADIDAGAAERVAAEIDGYWLEIDASRSATEDLGAVAVCLCSETASMITGAALEVDGGRCI